jgi:hypothetical protein
MFRSILRALVVIFIALSSVPTVHAQGWGWDAWGGWGSTPQGSIAQGMGHYYAGAGIFNERTAIADSINADTLMRWNDYIYQANDEAARRYVARRRANSANVREQNESIITRIRDNPTARDIEMGDALNAAVNQLTIPEYPAVRYGWPLPRLKRASYGKSRFETRARRSSSCSARSKP